MTDAEKRSFDGSFESLNLLFKLYPQGVAFHCPVCDTPLNVTLNWDDAIKHKTHPGIYCPTDPSHVYRMFNIKRSNTKPT